MAVVSAVMGNAYVLFKKNLNTVIEPPQLWQQGQKRLAVNAWHYLQNGIKSPHLQVESMGTRLRNWSDVSDRKSSFNFSLLLWWKLFFSSLYSLLKRFVLSMCKQMVLEFQACQCSHNGSAGLFVHLFGKQFFPPGLIKIKAAAQSYQAGVSPRGRFLCTSSLHVSREAEHIWRLGVLSIVFRTWLVSD